MRGGVMCGRDPSGAEALVFLGVCGTAKSRALIRILVVPARILGFTGVIPAHGIGVVKCGHDRNGSIVRED